MDMHQQSGTVVAGGSLTDRNLARNTDGTLNNDNPYMMLLIYPTASGLGQSFWTIDIAAWSRLTNIAIL